MPSLVNFINCGDANICKNQNHGSHFEYTVKLGNKERFDKEQIGIKEPFPATNLPFTS